MIDDILAFGQSQEEHDHRLELVLERINKAEITLNSEKCEFSKKSVMQRFDLLGHIGREFTKVGYPKNDATQKC